MKQDQVLIDASNLHTGGGVQVAASFINELLSAEAAPAWLQRTMIQVSSEVHLNLSPEAHRRVEVVDAKPSLRFLLPMRPRFDVAFSVFGPTYRPRLARYEIVGFADPTLPPGYAPPDAQTNQGYAARLRTCVKRFRIKKADHLIVETQTFADSLKHLGIPPSRITLAANSVSTAVLEMVGKRSPIPFGSSDPITLIYPARPYLHKNHSFLGALHREMATRGVPVRFMVTLTSAELDGLDADTRAACVPLGIISQRELAASYMEAQGVIFPTLLEVASATPIEALSLSLPFFGSDRAFVREQASGAGWYFDPHDPRDAADRLCEALADPDEVARRVELGAERAKKAPTAGQRACQYVETIDAFLQMARTQPSPSIPNVIVAHPAQQHSMRTAAALKHAGFQVDYVTTVYDRPDSLTRKVRMVLSGENRARVDGRRSAQLENAEVTQIHEAMSLLMLLLQRLPKARSFYRAWFRALTLVFNWRLARLVSKRRPASIVCYDTFAAGIFAALAKRNPEVIRVLDMSAPAAPAVDRLLRAEAERGNGLGLVEDMQKELGSFFYRANLEYTKREIQLADHFLVASLFTARSLETLGVSKDRIHLCRYGHAVSAVDADRHRAADPGPLRVIFVGRVTAEKGAHIFLDVVRELGCEEFTFTVVGAWRSNSFHPDSFPGVKFTGHVARQEVEERLSEADVLVFPSLADGFGFAALEAMAASTVVICSDSAGIADLVRHGENGFVVPSRDRSQIVALLRMLHGDRATLARVKTAGHETAQTMCWARYDREIAAAFNDIFPSKGN